MGGDIDGLLMLGTGGESRGTQLRAVGKGDRGDKGEEEGQRRKRGGEGGATSCGAHRRRGPAPGLVVLLGWGDFVRDTRKHQSLSRPASVTFF